MKLIWLVLVVHSYRTISTSHWYTPFIKRNFWSKMKNITGTLIESPYEILELVTFVTCQLTSACFRMKRRSNLFEPHKGHYVPCPRIKTRKANIVSYSQMNLWGILKIRLVSSHFPWLHTDPQQNSKKANYLPNCNIFPLMSQK